MLVEGQGYFVLPPEDNYNLPLDPYEAAQTVVVFCFYNETGATPNYVFRKDGVHIDTTGGDVFDTVTVPNQGVQVIVNVPNGDYTPSVEGTYTCSVTVNGQSRGTRDTIVSLPGKFILHHEFVSYVQSGSVC